MPLDALVGREHEQQLYKEFLKRDPQRRDSPWVMIVTGKEGFGKTVFLKFVEEYTRSMSPAPVAVKLDFTNELLRSDALKILGELAQQLEFRCNKRQIQTFNKTLENGRIKLVDRNMQVMQNINVGNEASSEGAQLSTSLNEAALEAGLQVRELVTSAFYTLIKSFRPHRLVIIFDSCEWLSRPHGLESAVAKWLVDDFFPSLHARMRQNHKQCYIVMASRTPLQLRRIDSHDQQHIHLSTPVQQSLADPKQIIQNGFREKLLKNRLMQVTLSIVLVCVLVASFAISIIHNSSSNIPTPNLNCKSSYASTVTNKEVNSPSSNGMYISQALDGEYIGISDGRFAFDVGPDRPDASIKRQAAAKLQAGDTKDAMLLWKGAVAKDTNDAEALIYQEDQAVLASGHPHITVVVGTMLTGKYTNIGRDNLQGAYVAQKEFNDGSKLPNDLQVLLLIANSGSGDESNALVVARQIVQAAQVDATIVGVMGWPSDQSTINAIQVLGEVGIPMVSPSASSDSLSGISPYFFRVVPPISAEASVGSQYAEQTLNARKIALFVDSSNIYSCNLAKDFLSDFTAQAYPPVQIFLEYYTSGKPVTLTRSLRDALSHTPDLIYYAGYAQDVRTLLASLPTSGEFAHLKVMGGDALYELGDDYRSTQIAFDRLYFTLFAHPDEWGLQLKPLPFFCEYTHDFDPHTLCLGQNTKTRYGFNRADSETMLSYDAMLTLLAGSNSALTNSGQKSITPDELQQALKDSNSNVILQGVTGPISFSSTPGTASSDPVNKPVLLIYVDAQGQVQIEPQGCLRVDHCS